MLVVFLEQAGIPIPAIPALLAMGTLGGTGYFALGPAFLLASAAAMAGDMIWYVAGRTRGRSVLKLLCRVSIEPDSCVRTTENAYARIGAGALLFSKFVPGLSTAAPPLAGLTGISTTRFLVYDAAGTIIWVGTFLTLGYMFRDQIEPLLEWLDRTGGRLAFIISLTIALYVAWKWFQRRRFIRKMRIARITPEDVMAKISAGENPVMVDLRSVGDGDMRLPGAIAMAVADLETRHQEIPRDRDIIVYCS